MPLENSSTMNILSFLMTLLILQANNDVAGKTSIPSSHEKIRNIKIQLPSLDSLEKAEFSCKRLTIADTQTSVKEIKQKIAKNLSYILIYRKESKWILEKDMSKSLSIINSSQSNKIVYCEDDIQIFGIQYPDVKYTVIIQ